MNWVSVKTWATRPDKSGPQGEREREGEEKDDDSSSVWPRKGAR